MKNVVNLHHVKGLTEAIVKASTEYIGREFPDVDKEATDYLALNTLMSLYVGIASHLDTPTKRKSALEMCAARMMNAADIIENI